VEVGRVAGADLGGLSLGAILTALLIAKVNRRYLVLGAVVIAIGANANSNMLNARTGRTLSLPASLRMRRQNGLAKYLSGRPSCR
jgi:hypothetical protein